MSPVYFTHDAYWAFYWVSSPDAQHSKNLAARASVAIVIYEPPQPPRGGGNAFMVLVPRSRESEAGEMPSTAELATTKDQPDLVAQVDDVQDDVLRLIFMTCHPVVPGGARVALTPRLLGGLSTPGIARAM